MGVLAPRKCSANSTIVTRALRPLDRQPQTIPPRDSSPALAEIPGSRHPRVPEEPVSVLSSQHCNPILGITVQTYDPLIPFQFNYANLIIHSASNHFSFLSKSVHQRPNEPTLPIQAQSEQSPGVFVWGWENRRAPQLEHRAGPEAGAEHTSS